MIPKQTYAACVEARKIGSKDKAFVEVAVANSSSAPHSDDVAVDLFAIAMKAKMAASRAKGRSGWDDPDQCSVDHLFELLKRAVWDGDAVDIGNYAMMVHIRRQEVKS